MELVYKFMRTTVDVGDSYEVGGVPMIVAEVKRGTDGQGEVAFETAGVRARLKRVEGMPLVVSHDEVFACYLLRGREDVGVYAVGVYHPTLGERIAPGVPQAAPFVEELTLCWAPGRIRVLIEGTPAAGESVSLMLQRSTKDGAAQCLLPDKYKVLLWSETWEALVDSGERDEPYKTDAEGYVYNAVLREGVMFPRGEGAFGQRRGDRLYEGAPEPEEYTERVWVLFRGQRAELREGEDVTLDWQMGTIVATGPAGAWVRAELEGVGNDPVSVTCRAAGEIPPGGELTLGGLYPGRYCVSAWLPGGGIDRRDWSAIAPRQWVSVEAGGRASVGIAFETPPAGYYLVYVYKAGADVATGVEVLGLLPPEGYGVVGTVDGGGRALVACDPVPFAMLINDEYWGYQQLRGEGPTFEATLGGYMVLGVSLGFGGEAGWWAFPGEGHEHLDAYAPYWRVKVEETGEVVGCEAVPIGARTAVALPHLPAGVVDGWSFTPPEATYEIVLVDPEGERVKGLQEPAVVARDGNDTSKLVLEVLGGKAWGDVLGHDPAQSTEPGLPEAARLGLEHGRLLPAVVQRYLREEQGALEGRLGWVCPYCLGMTMIWPGPGHGFCPQCGSDARTYLHGPPVGEGRWRVRNVALGPRGSRAEVLCEQWYRPLEYAETDEYLVMYEGLPRWVCRHPLLGEWRAGVWMEGTDAEELEAAWCRPGERLLVRPKRQVVGQAAGDATYRLRYRTEGGELRSLDFELRAGETGVRLLSSLAPVWAEVKDPAELLFVRRVTSVSLLEPEEDPGNRFLVVGDIPSLVTARLRIERAWATHFALQIGALRRASGPDLRLTPDGRLYVAYVKEGDVYVRQRPSPQRPWSEAVLVTDGGQYTDPSITILPTGVMVLAYTHADTGEQHLATSWDDGETWWEVG